MGSGAPSGAAHQRNPRSLGDHLALAHHQPTVVGITGGFAITVGDLNQIAIGTTPAGKRDDASFRRMDGCTCAVGNIDAFVDYTAPSKCLLIISGFRCFVAFAASKFLLLTLGGGGLT